MFPSPRVERVSPSHLVAIAKGPDGPHVVVWRWHAAVVVGTEDDGRFGCGSGRTGRSSPNHGRPTRSRIRGRERTRLQAIREPRGGSTTVPAAHSKGTMS